MGGAFVCIAWEDGGKSFSSIFTKRGSTIISLYYYNLFFPLLFLFLFYFEEFPLFVFFIGSHYLFLCILFIRGHSFRILCFIVVVLSGRVDRQH